MGSFVSWLRQHPSLIAALGLVGLVLIVTIIAGYNNDVEKAKRQKDHDERVRVVMNAAAADRNAATPWPIASATKTPSALSSREQTERDTAAGIALKVSEPVDEILTITDESLRYIHRLSGVKKLSRMEYLYLSAMVIDQSAKERDPKQKLKKDSLGKHSFSEISIIVNRTATAASSVR